MNKSVYSPTENRDSLVSLASAWRVYKEEMGIPDNKSRKAEYVAGRAAFCVVMYKTRFYSLATIGSVMGKDHATVLYLMRNADIKYKRFAHYRNGLQLAADLVPTLAVPTTQVQIVNNSYVESELQQERKNGERISIENIKLMARVKKLESIISESRQYIHPIRVEISKMTNAIHALGYETRGNEYVDLLNKTLTAQ